MKSRIRRSLVLTGAVVTLSIALTGCSALVDLLGGGAGDADRDEAGQVTESANIGVFSLKVGDCLLDSGSGLLEDVDVVPCAEPHDQEVYHEIKMKDGEYSDKAVQKASEECIGDAYTSFVGVSFDNSVLEVSQITPSEDSWNDYNDRTVQCLINDTAGETEGSLKGTKR